MNTENSIFDLFKCRSSPPNADSALWVTLFLTLFKIMLVDIIVTCLWVWPVASWCMCFYIIFASCEGLRWFDARQNPYLIVGCLGGAVVCGLWGAHQVPSSSIFIAAWGWSLYSTLVTVQYWRFRLIARHIAPVNAPLVVLLWWFSSRQE